MAVIGTLLKNRRAGQDGLAWNAPNLAGVDTLDLRSPDFAHEAVVPTVHAARRVGNGPVPGPGGEPVLARGRLDGFYERV
ncbi:hypothetical protein ACFQZC_06305 [Streptacidiphilus monticola]